MKIQEQNISKNNFEQCIKCTVCTVYCPVVPVNPNYPGPKQAGPDGERYRLKKGLYFDETLKYCMNCKRCEVACPSGVRIGDIIQTARIKHEKGSPKLRDMMLASTDFMGPIASTFAPIVNGSLKCKPIKAVLDAALKIPKERTLPTYASETFEKWFHKNAEAQQDSYSKHVAYYHGCYANYNYPKLGKDFVAIMNAFGYGVHLLEEEKCCGIAKISSGMISKAKKDAVHNVEVISKAVEKGMPVVTVSTSCTMTIRDEYPHLLGVDNSKVRDNIQLVERFLYKAISAGDIKLVWKSNYKAKVAYHQSCHMERLGWGIFTSELCKMIPGVEFMELDSNCCGIAGTYGFKKENYKTSQEIGRPLFNQIKKVNPDYIACECETCKWQIEMSTGYTVKNPVSILAEALDLEATAAANRR